MLTVDAKVGVMGIQEVFVKLKEYTCERCGHVWRQRVPRSDDPLTCAKCRSAYWNRPRRTDSL
jgi:hypothetical protein